MNATTLSVGETASNSLTASESCAPPVVCAVLMPHAPILVPGVGGGRSHAASASCRAMRTAAHRVVHHQPGAVVLISPHSPRKAGAYGIWTDDPVKGSLGHFNAPQAQVSLPNDPELANAVKDEAGALGVETWSIRGHVLDHGAIVPLWFLAEAGWAGPTLVVGMNQPHAGGLAELGQALAAAARRLHRRVALVASGDMSHRLQPGAPCGFHPSAHRFDEMFIELLGAGSYHEFETMPPDLRELAAEDAVDSTLIAVAAVDWSAQGHEVLNYEGPFGVGYGVAILFETEIPRPADGQRLTRSRARAGGVLPRLARRAVLAALSDSLEPPPVAHGNYLNARRGVFVTIRNRRGGLRGCVGTVEPACPNLVAEIWRSAQLAALHDRRFTPVQPGELDDLRFEVSALHSLEEVSSAADLDPDRFGVVVTTNDGRRGLLLPGVRGIHSGVQQLNLAREKGWIDAQEPATIQRFQVDHYEETSPAT